MEPLTFARLSERLDAVEPDDVAPAFERLARRHTRADEGERIDGAVLDDAETALEELTNHADDLAALRAGTLAETASKREMRDLALELQRTANAFYGVRSSLADERADIERPSAYDGTIEEAETALEELIDELEAACSDLRNRG